MAPLSPQLQKCELERLLNHDLLTALFQPIAAQGGQDIVAYEGLIRGPSDSYLHSPVNLFTAADRCGMLQALDFAARRTVIRSFVKADLPGLLFLNVTPACLAAPGFRSGTTLEILSEAGLSPHRVVIELTEIHPADSLEQLRQALCHYRDMGFRIAIDDLGEGFSGLRLWSELQPDYVKIDKYFIQDIDTDAQKRQFVRSIHHIALNTGARVIAEGVETREEFAAVRRIGIDMIQGYYLARPQANPPRTLNLKVLETDSPRREVIGRQTARSLLAATRAVEQGCSNTKVYEQFCGDPELYALPVLDDAGLPIGLLQRHKVIECFARPYSRELYGQRPCTMLMDAHPLIVEHSISLEELSRLITSCERRYLADGFIITDGGRFMGMGAGHDLMRAITDLQIRAARHANPLTLLPGNVPLQEEITRLLAAEQSFVVVYADLDHFKPYNDIYGYDRGDEMIRLLGHLLQQTAAPELDFVGHIGGDDFLLLMRSSDWQSQCETLLARFDLRVRSFFEAQHLKAGGYCSPDRQGKICRHALVSLSLGAVQIEPAYYASHHEIAAAAAMAKQMAKRDIGSSLFIERRKPLQEDIASRDAA